MTRNKRRNHFKEKGGSVCVTCGRQVKYDGNGVWPLERITRTLITAVAGVKSEGNNDKVEKADQDSSPQEFGCAE